MDVKKLLVFLQSFVSLDGAIEDTDDGETSSIRLSERNSALKRASFDVLRSKH